MGLQIVLVQSLALRMQGRLRFLLSPHILSLLVHGSCLCLQLTPVLRQLLPASQQALLPNKGGKGQLKTVPAILPVLRQP